MSSFFEKINGMDGDSGYMVAWEWDGMQPVSMYYRRMKKLGFKVGVSSESTSPLVRRANNKSTGGVIFQEGMVIVPTMSAARVIFWLVSDLGAKNVVIGTVSLTDAVFKSRADAEILNRIERKFGRRGRKPDDIDWALSCTDCVTVHHVKDWAPLECPNCGSFLTRSRKGVPIYYSDAGAPLIETWLRTRFTGPHWEPVDIDPSGMEPPPLSDVRVGNSRELDTIEWMKNSPSLLTKLNHMPRESALEFMDCILISRSHRDPEERNIERAYIAAEYMKRGGDPASISIMEPTRKNELDLVSSAPIMPRKKVVGWLLELNGGNQ